MKNYPLSIKMFISLSLLLIATVVIFTIISNYAVMDSSKNEIGKNCIGKLKVAENNVLQFKNTVNRDTIALSVNTAINALRDISNLNNDSKWVTDTQNLFKLSETIDIILQTVNTNSSYHSIYLYLEDLGYSLTSNQGFIPNTELKDTGWLKYYNDFKDKGTPLSWVKTRLPYNSNSYAEYLSPSCVITHIYPLTPYTTSLRGALVINIKEEILSKLINTNNLQKEGYIFIIDNEGNVISHINKQFLCKNISRTDYIDNILSNYGDEGYLVTQIDEKNSLISFYKSNNNEWIYIGVFSLECLIDSVNSIRIYTVYIPILIIIIGIIAAYLITKKLYTPVKKLIQDIKVTRGIDIFENRDEMLILRRAFESLSNELEKNKQNIQVNSLSNLLTGKYSCEMINDCIMEMDFRYMYFVCAVMSIDKYKEFSRKYKTEKQYYLKMLILSITEEVIKTTYRCIGINMDNGEIALLINVNSIQGNELQKSLRVYFQKIQEEIKKVFDYTISIGIGSCYHGYDKIKKSYMEASEALKHKLIYGYGSIIVWHKNLIEHKYYYPFDVEKHILNQIESKNINAIENTIKELVDQIKNKIHLSSDNVMHIFNQLVGNTVVKYLINSNIDMNHVFGNNFNIYNGLSKKETLDDIQCWLINIYDTIINYCINYGSSDKDYINLIMEYIQKNYKNDIGVQDVADHVGLSYSYVRKIFKDETGENIVDFINSIRIKEAKNLLIYADINVKDLSKYLGYNSDQSFTRVFKKLEGITPGKYRSINRDRN